MELSNSTAQTSTSVFISYPVVVLIWSTTPIAIKWSAEGAGFMFGVFFRMLIGTLLSLLLVYVVLGKRLPFNKQAVQVYSAAGVSIFGAMSCVYWGAQYIPSGLISVLFNFTPMLTSLLAYFWLAEKNIRFIHITGMLLGLLGLYIIFKNNIGNASIGIQGIIAVMAAVILHAGSAVTVKYLRAPVSALEITTGGLLFSLPLFTLAWILVDFTIPFDIDERSLLSIIYLGVAGSVIGFVLYYHLLEHLKASSVALITLITPVSALLIGALFNNETITASIWYGTMMILAGLSLHQWGGVFIDRWRS